MPVATWSVWLAASGLLAGLSLWHYRRRETPGRGRPLLALLRASTLALILLLLLRPELPARDTGGAGGIQVLLDASLSMGLPADPDGATRWDQAVAIARQRSGGRPVLLFGAASRPVAVSALPEEAPRDGRTLLVPALQAAAEAGVRRVVVVTDGGIEDAAAAAAWVPRLGMEVVVERVGEALTNRSLVEVTVPAQARAGDVVAVEFAALGGGPDSMHVIAALDGRVVGRTSLAPPAAGRLAAGALELRVAAPPGGGWVRLDLELEGRDAVPDDDRRTAYIHVSERPAGVVLVSLQPDWEPRFLAPALERALALPLHAWIRTAEGRYARLAGGIQAGGTAAEDEIRSAVAGAELVVLHGLGADAPGWAIEAAARARRVIVFPADAAGDVALPAVVGPQVEGDWYVADVPSSPVAAFLAGDELRAAAPLTSARAVTPPAGAWAPLLVARGRQGSLQPAALAGETAGRRWVVVAASGFWRWAFRGEAERGLYNRFWAALAGWVVQDRGTAGPSGVRPAERAVPRGRPLAWVAPGLAIDSMVVRLLADDGTVAADTVVATAAGDTAWTAAPMPGTYSYRIEAFGDGTVTAAEGPLTVERYSPELLRPVADLDGLRAAASVVRGGARGAGRTPLHATPWPWMLLIALLATEWILRRRWGLR
jgi:hypothetical protein